MDESSQGENKIKSLATWQSQSEFMESNSRGRSSTPENGSDTSLSPGKTFPIDHAQSAAELYRLTVTPPLSEKELPLMDVPMPSDDCFSLTSKVNCEEAENQMEILLTLMVVKIEAETVTPTTPFANNNVTNPEVGSVKVEPIVGPTSVVIQESPQPIIHEDHSELSFTAGDAVWGFLSGYPLWPSLVTVDPVENVFTKTKMVGKTEVRFYHVQFFGDNGSHCWIAANVLFPFEGGVEQLMKNEAFMKHAASRSKVFLSLKNKRQNWPLALDEAKESLQKAKEERHSSLLKTVELKAAERKRKRNSEEVGERKPKRRRQSKEAANLEESISTEAKLTPVAGKRTPSEASSHQTEGTVSDKENHPEKLTSAVVGQEDLEARKIAQERKDLEMKIEVCELCDLRDGQLLSCTKCRSFYHADCCLRGKKKQQKGEPEPKPKPASKFLCLKCDPASEPTCCLCNQSGGQLIKCNQARSCSRQFHQECLKGFHSLSAKNQRSTSQFDCPAHFCHTCTADIGEIPKPDKTQLIHCIQCPTAYHPTEKCLAVGCVQLSVTQMICFKHIEGNVFSRKNKGTKKVQRSTHISLDMCVVCSEGGSLICCERCPKSFHALCAGLAKEPEGSFMCDECLSGRPILYGDIVWAKIGSFRWWPAKVVPRDEIPLQHQKHKTSPGEILVYFYGDNNYAFVYRGQVFLYQDGDQVSKCKSKKKLDDNFNEALELVKPAFQERKAVLSQWKTERRSKLDLRPPTYRFINSNRSVGKVKIRVQNSDDAPQCECNGVKMKVVPCGPDSECINRNLLTECDPRVCRAKGKCGNQRFRKHQTPPLYPFDADGKGWGLKSQTEIKKGDFVVEYAGELIDNTEFQRRLKEKQDAGDEAFYFLRLDSKRMIDAGPSGSLGRFMNHSCQPNCETQKWTVMGDIRIGLFASTDIPADTELTFNYQLECAPDAANEDKRQQPCQCGAPNCSGFIGAKPKQPEAVKPPKGGKSKNSKAKKLPKGGKLKEDKKEKPKQKPAKKVKVAEVECFLCTGDGSLVLCDLKNCSKVYHVDCLDRSAPPKRKWTCPWHYCDVCADDPIQCCQICPKALCLSHAVDEVEMKLHDILGLVCNEHSQEEVDFFVKRHSELPGLVLSPQPSTSSSFV